MTDENGKSELRFYVLSAAPFSIVSTDVRYSLN